jgi:hypothetical protein
MLTKNKPHALHSCGLRLQDGVVADLQFVHCVCPSLLGATATTVASPELALDSGTPRRADARPSSPRMKTKTAGVGVCGGALTITCTAAAVELSLLLPRIRVECWRAHMVRRPEPAVYRLAAQPRTLRCQFA